MIGPSRRLALNALFAMTVSASASAENPRVALSTTMGDMTIELFAAEAPETVSNFLALVDDGFYEGLVFHRVVPGFVIQAGGHEADMTYRPAPRTVRNESDNGLRNERYTLSMARLAAPDSAGAQFFVNLADNETLDYRRGRPGYAVFGKLVDGQDVVRAIEQVRTTQAQTSQGALSDVPVEPVVITGAARQ